MAGELDTGGDGRRLSYLAGRRRLALRSGDAQRTGQPRRANATPARGVSLGGVEPAEVVLSAVKKAGDEDALVVRVYNTIDRDVTARLSFCVPVQEVRTISLAEPDLGLPPLEVDGHAAVALTPGAHEIRTLRVK